jgi:hypothetical protein
LSDIKTEIENRKILYFNKYQYRAKFAIPGMYHLWHNRTPEDLDYTINQHINLPGARSTTWGRRHYSMDLLDNRILLMTILMWIQDNKDSITMRIEGNNCSVFSNDIYQLKSLGDIISTVKTTTVVPITYTKAELYGDPEVIELLKPKHNYRVYFKNKGIRNTSFMKDINELLELHKNTLFPCRALRCWIDDEKHQPVWKYNWISPSHFIEYDNESAKVLLALFLDGYLAKTYKVVQRES